MNREKGLLLFKSLPEPQKTGLFDSPGTSLHDETLLGLMIECSL